MLHAEVVVLEVDVKVRKDETVFNELPNDASHFVAVEFDDGIINLDFGHGAPPCVVIAQRPQVLSLVLYLSTLAPDGTYGATSEPTRKSDALSAKADERQGQSSTGHADEL